MTFNDKGKLMSGLPEEAKDQLNALFCWDMSAVKSRMISDYPYLKDEYLKELELEYKKYISLLLYFPDTRRPISAAVDVMWHTHLLFTKNYTAFSNQILGKYIHHCPAEGRLEAENMKPSYLKNTISEYRKIYGTENVKFWPTLFDGESHCSSSNCD